MALTVTHAFTSNIADDPKAAAAGEVLPSHWNATHVVTGGIGRTILSADTTYYISTAGSDSNNGSIGSPWATLQHAWNTIADTIDGGGFAIAFQLADGTYNGLRALGDIPNCSFISILGNAGDATKVTITDVSLDPLDFAPVQIDVIMTSVVFVDQVTLNTTFAANWGFANTQWVNANFGTVNFTNTSGSDGDSCFAIFSNCIVQFGYNPITQTAGLPVSVANNWAHFMNVSFGAQIVQAGVLTLVGTPNFSQYFAVIQQGANYKIDQLAPPPFSGSATGNRMHILNGTIQTVDHDTALTFLPGNALGFAEAGFYESYEFAGVGFAGVAGASYTVADLPGVTNVPIGQRWFVSDSNTSLAAGIGNIVVASTSTSTAFAAPVYNDGTNWRLG